MTTQHTPTSDQIRAYRNATVALINQTKRRLSEAEEAKLEAVLDALDREFPNICVLADQNIALMNQAEAR